jgi:Flp pilus assembly protein TadG
MTTHIRRIMAEGDRGSAPIEMAITGLLAVGLIGLLVVGGRVAIASSNMSDVAGSAARDASIARTAPQARQIAQSSAAAALTSQNLHCEGGAVVLVDTSGFAAGSPASIRVDLTCVVSLSDVGIPGLPGSRTLRDHASSPLDPFRSRP